MWVDCEATRSLPMSATRRRLCGGVPRLRSKKYWPEPVDELEVMGSWGVGVLWRCKAEKREERRWVSEERASDGEGNGVSVAYGAEVVGSSGVLGDGLGVAEICECEDGA
ncbi:hypothetical protein F0562_017031 [Nyssa sinensis]|uniref:Uncharacterized protein n=1 Tax=Nyssa sinensis TaxID=561372 RepID=A0A5J4ZHV0_9ASTE|nr:hypothetical protein F0562_017031 [Nyssa sinensis]